MSNIYVMKIKNISNFINFKVSDLITEYYGNINYYTNIPKSKTFNKLLCLSYNYNLYKKFENDSDIIFVKEILEPLKHFRDNRKYYEYAADLILGWCLEDFLIKKISSSGQLISTNSADKNREFLKESIRASSDLFLNRAGIKIEVMQNYTDFWEKNSVLHLRDNKFSNLLSENAILLGIDFYQNKIVILNLKNCNYKFIPSHSPYGGKPAYEISISNFLEYSYLDKFIENMNQM